MKALITNNDRTAHKTTVGLKIGSNSLMLFRKRKTVGRIIVAFSFLLLIFLTGSCRGEKEIRENAGNSSVTKASVGSRPMKEDIIMLPEPVTKGNISLEETLMRRKSVRQFQNRKLNPEQVSQLMWSAQGINRKGTQFKTCPSAGATYPLTAYGVTEEGIFRYIPEGHKLIKIMDGDHREALSRACLGQKCVLEAPLSIIFTAVYENTTGRYGDRGIMYVHMEAGHAAQNIHLQAVALGLGSVPVGAFSDEDVSKIIRCKNQEIPIYIIPVGYAR